jgi:hypothetical protein
VLGLEVVAEALDPARLVGAAGDALGQGVERQPGFALDREGHGLAHRRASEHFGAAPSTVLPLVKGQVFEVPDP